MTSLPSHDKSRPYISVRSNKLISSFFSAKNICLVLFLAMSNWVFGYITHNGIVSGVWAAGTHFIESNVTVLGGTTLTIEPDAILKFNSGTQLTAVGTVNAIGAIGQEIFCTSINDDTVGEIINGSSGSPLPGDWHGIKTAGSSPVLNLDRCWVGYGGNPASDFDSAIHFNSGTSGSFTNSTCTDSASDGISIENSSPNISGSIIRDSAARGLYVYGGLSSAPTILGNVFTDNMGYAAYLDNATLTGYSGNSGSGNGINGMGLKGQVSASQSWASGAPTFPFVLFDKVTVLASATLTIAAGTIIKAISPGELMVVGQVNATGTSGNEIVFTSLKDNSFGGDTFLQGTGNADPPGKGDWNGIYVFGVTNPGIGHFDHCWIGYGGDTASPFNANLHFHNSSSGSFTNSTCTNSGADGISLQDCSPNIANSTITDSTTRGLYAFGSTSSTAPTLTGNVFTNNVGLAVDLDGVGLTSYSGNSGSGNGMDGIEVHGITFDNHVWTGINSFKFYLSGNIGIDGGGSVNLLAGTLECGTHQFNGAGSFTVSSGATLGMGHAEGISASGSTGNVQTTIRNFDTAANYHYNGSAPQITGSGLPAVVNGLQINNGAGVALTNSVAASNMLEMLNGNIFTNACTLTLGSSATNVGALTRTSGTIIGNFERWIGAAAANDILFPIGTPSHYRPVNISYATAPTSGGTLTASHTELDPGQNGLPLNDNGVDVVNYSMDGYWTVDSANGLTGGNYNMDLAAPGFVGINDVTLLRIIKRALGGIWLLDGVHVNGTGTPSSPIVHRSNMTGYSEFGIASPAVNPLPIELLNFEAIPKNQRIELIWQTASETNNRGFEIQKSSDAQVWENIAFINRHGDSENLRDYHFLDENPFPGKNYYRLKQIDLDGAFRFSEIVVVEFQKTSSDIFIYPNPCTDYFEINFSENKKARLIERIEIFSTNGELVQTFKHIRADEKISTKTLRAGMKIVKIWPEDGQPYIERLVVE